MRSQVVFCAQIMCRTDDFQGRVGQKLVSRICCHAKDQRCGVMHYVRPGKLDVDVTSIIQRHAAACCRTTEPRPARPSVFPRGLDEECSDARFERPVALLNGLTDFPMEKLEHRAPVIGTQVAEVHREPAVLPEQPPHSSSAA